MSTTPASTPYAPTPGAVSIAHRDGFLDASHRWRKFIEKTLVDLAGGKLGIGSATTSGKVIREPQKTLVEALARVVSFDPLNPISEVDPYDLNTLEQRIRRASIDSHEDLIKLPRQTVHYLLAYLHHLQSFADLGEELFARIGPLDKTNPAVSAEETLSLLALLRKAVLDIQTAYRAG